MQMNGTVQDRRARHFEALVLQDMKTLPLRKGVTWRSSGVGIGFSVDELPICVYVRAKGLYEGFVAGHHVHTGSACDVANKCLRAWDARPELQRLWAKKRRVSR